MRNVYFTETGQIVGALRALAADLEAAGAAELPPVALVVDFQVRRPRVVDPQQQEVVEVERQAAVDWLGEALRVPVTRYRHTDGSAHCGNPGQRRHGATVSIYAPMHRHQQPNASTEIGRAA